VASNGPSAAIRVATCASAAWPAVRIPRFHQDLRVANYQPDTIYFRSGLFRLEELQPMVKAILGLYETQTGCLPGLMTTRSDSRPTITACYYTL